MHQARWTGFIAVILSVLLDSQAFAQKTDYQPGEQIEWRASDYPEKWVKATFVKATPSGAQPIIREMPNEFSKDGYQRATRWDAIRSVQTARMAPAAVVPPAAQQPQRARADAVNEQPRTMQAGNTTAEGLGGGLMSQAEILGFLQTNLGSNPYQNPRFAEIKNELAEMIKRRGVNFRHESATDFYRQLPKYGANTTDVDFPLTYNYGAPTKQSWLLGSWQLSKIGATVDYVKDNAVYRQGEIGVGNVGALNIKADGSYDWKSVTSPSSNGRWRKASPQEMGHHGGDGIVLTKAKGGEDWIVIKDRQTTLKGNWINLAQVDWRSIRETGTR